MKDKKVTDKTEEQLIAANWNELTLEEKALRSDMERHPNMLHKGRIR
jgi:hypothetical protein